MRLRSWLKPDPGLERRIRVIVLLGWQRDRLLERPELDLPALRQLVEAYEAAGMACVAASLRRRLEHYEAIWGAREGKSQWYLKCLRYLKSLMKSIKAK